MNNTDIRTNEKTKKVQGADSEHRASQEQKILRLYNEEIKRIKKNRGCSFKTAHGFMGIFFRNNFMRKVGDYGKREHV